MVAIDNEPAFKVESKEGTNVVELATGLAPTSHRITITYCIEGLLKNPVFYGLILDEGARLLERPTLPERRIEFIGNSITC